MKLFHIGIEKNIFCGQKENGEMFLGEVLITVGISEIKPGGSHLAEK